MPYNYAIVLPQERSFDPQAATEWMKANWQHSLTISAIYVLAIFGGQRFMRSRTALSLKYPLALWNGALAVFSILGMIRLAPDFFHTLFTKGFTHSVCILDFRHGVTGFWTNLFALSKIVELGDTLFIVLRKRPLIFLHWYHHITVFVYTWYAFKEQTASGRWFIMMNYTVHATMYTYYALRAIGFRFGRHIPMVITSLQLAQMFVGWGIAIYVYWLKSLDENSCLQSFDNLRWSFLMYFSYFLLFLNFFYRAYFVDNKYAKEKSMNGIVGSKNFSHSLQENGVICGDKEKKTK